MKTQINIQIVKQKSKRIGRSIIEKIDFFFDTILPNVLGGTVVLVIIAKIIEVVLT